MRKMFLRKDTHKLSYGVDNGVDQDNKNALWPYFKKHRTVTNQEATEWNLKRISNMFLAKKKKQINVITNIKSFISDLRDPWPLGQF